MAGLFLFRDLKGILAFDPERARSCLRGLRGIRNWDEDNPQYAFFCEFDFARDSTIVYMLNADLQFISIDGMGDASLQIAMEIGQRYGEEIYAVDEEGSSFAIILSTVSSLSDFNDKIERDVGKENLPPGQEAMPVHRPGTATSLIQVIWSFLRWRREKQK